MGKWKVTLIVPVKPIGRPSVVAVRLVVTVRAPDKAGALVMAAAQVDDYASAKWELEACEPCTEVH